MRIDIYNRVFASLLPKVAVGFLPIVIFALTSIAISQAQQQQGRRTWVGVYADCAYPNWGKDGESSIKIGSLEIKLNDRGEPAIASTLDYPKLTPGTYQISVHTPFSDKLSKVRLTPMTKHGYGEAYEVKADASGIATVTLDADFWGPPDERASPYLNIDVSCGDKEKKNDEGKDILVVMTSHYCKSSPDWLGLKVKIGEIELDAMDADNVPKREGEEEGEIRTKSLKIKPGKHEISVHSTDFPKTTLQEADVFIMYSSTRTKSVSTYPADASGLVTVTLDKNLWEKGDKFLGPALRIKVFGNCEDPKTDPKEFGIVTVKAISGEVEAKQPHLRFLAERGLPPFMKAKVDDEYREGTIIKTGADGLIVLESEYKHTISIENSTEVKLGTLMTASGRRQLRALIEKGKIKIERQSSDADDESASTTVETKTATVNSAKTVYTVSYDEKTKLTSVGVEEGQVEVFPANEALQSVTLTANQQVQVAENNISPITAFAPDKGGSNTASIVFYVGISITVLLAISGLLFFLYRQHRRATQPAFHQAGINLGVMMGSARADPTAAATKRCPNPQCGRTVPAHYKYCSSCRSHLE